MPAKTNLLGAKGCGEAGCAGALPAVMNALVDALSEFGIRHIDMPATPLNVWEAIERQERRTATKFLGFYVASVEGCASDARVLRRGFGRRRRGTICVEMSPRLWRLPQETLQTAVKQCVFTVAPRERLFAEGRIPVRVLRNSWIFDGPMQHFAWPLWQELAGFDLIHVHQSLTIFGAFCTVVAKSLGKTLVLPIRWWGEQADA